MKRHVIIILLTSWAIASQASLVLDEDFTGYANGSIVGQTGGVYYTGAWGGSSEYEIRNNNYLELDGSAFPATNRASVSLANTFDVSTGGVYYASMRVRLKETDNYGQVVIAFRNSADDVVFGATLSHANFAVMNATGSKYNTIPQDLADGEWVNLYLKVEQKPDVSWKTKTTLWVNPTGEETGADFVLMSDAPNFRGDSVVSQFDFRAWQTQATKDGEYASIDSVRVGTSWAEVAMTSEPSGPPEVGSISVDVLSGNEVAISWISSNAANYVVESTTNLVAGPWIDVVTNVVGIGGSMSVTDTVDNTAAFYRVYSY